jgi:hypothetical protein
VVSEEDAAVSWGVVARRIPGQPTPRVREEPATAAVLRNSLLVCPI